LHSCLVGALLLYEFSTTLSCKVEQFCNKYWRIRGAPHATMAVTRAGEAVPNSRPTCWDGEPRAHWFQTRSDADQQLPTARRASRCPPSAI
jgi:hypothetical protein